MHVARVHSRPVGQRLRSAELRRMIVTLAAQHQRQQQQSAAAGTVKVLHLMRHGVTEMNEYLTEHRYDAEEFKDPMMYDTVLTPRGRAGAQAAARAAARLNPKPELLVVSPLTRALQTAQLAFLPHYSGPVLVEPLARERVWHASDVGNDREHLGRLFPEGRYHFDSLPDAWWYCVDPDNPRQVGMEPEDLFKERVLALRTWLAERPEQCIAVVAHWGLLHELTGGSEFENCQIRTFALDTQPVAAGGEPVLREQVPNLLAALFR